MTEKAKDVKIISVIKRRKKSGLTVRFFVCKEFYISSESSAESSSFSTGIFFLNFNSDTG